MKQSEMIKALANAHCTPTEIATVMELDDKEQKLFELLPPPKPTKQRTPSEEVDSSTCRLISVQTASKLLGFSTQRIHAMIRTGILPLGVVCHFGRNVRLDRCKLDEFLATGGQGLGNNRV